MRVLIAITLATALLTSTAPSASADDKGPGKGGVVDNSIYVGVQIGVPPASKTGTDSHQCTWTPAGEASTTESPVVDTKVVNGQTQHLYLRACPNAITQVWVSQTSPKNLGAIVTDMAKELIPEPSFGSAPASDTGLVNVDMWLWTDPESFATISTRKAWVPTPNGPLWAQATATPEHLVFTPGEPDSQPFACDGPGQAWEPAFGDDAKSACMYRYLHSSEISPSGTFSAQWSIVWSITWTSNAGGGETLPAYVSTTGQEITVKEVQAVIVG